MHDPMQMTVEDMLGMLVQFPEDHLTELQLEMMDEVLSNVVDRTP
jgi:hypothetical protein